MRAFTLTRVVFIVASALMSAPAAGEAPVPHEAEFDPEQPAPPPRVSEPQIERHKVAQRGGMLRIPGGEFSMGFEGGTPGEPNERPVHLVRVQPFWLDRTEVTVGEMRDCQTKGACTAQLGLGSSCTMGRSDPGLPANCVPWHAADAYCRAVGKRLPTEAEWEFAAAGGQKYRFPWGSAPPSCPLAVTLSNNRTGVSCSPQGPLPVGLRPKGASVFGVEDMAGNVEEWVADWYADRYEVQLSRRTAVPSPTGPAFGVAHVLRGGGWMSRPRDVRITARNWGSPNESGPSVGFRCAQD